jgi:hypothetical protein
MGTILHCYSVAVRSYPLFLPIWVENDLPEATNGFTLRYEQYDNACTRKLPATLRVICPFYPQLFEVAGTLAGSCKHVFCYDTEDVPATYPQPTRNLKIRFAKSCKYRILGLLCSRLELGLALIGTRCQSCQSALAGDSSRRCRPCRGGWNRGPSV